MVLGGHRGRDRMVVGFTTTYAISAYHQGRIQDFKLGGGGAHLKKLHRAEGGANIFGAFRVKNHDFTPTNYIFSNFRGGGGGAGAPPFGSAPAYHH